MGEGADTGMIGPANQPANAGVMAPPPATAMGMNSGGIPNAIAAPGKMEKLNAFLGDKESMMMLAQIGNSMMQGNRQLTPIGQGYYVRGGTQGAIRAGMGAATEQLSAAFMRAQKLEEDLDEEDRRTEEYDRRYRRGREDRVSDIDAARKITLSDRGAARELFESDRKFRNDRTDAAAARRRKEDIFDDEKTASAKVKADLFKGKATLKKEVLSNHKKASMSRARGFRAAISEGLKLSAHQETAPPSAADIDSGAATLANVVAMTREMNEQSEEFENLAAAAQGESARTKAKALKLEVERSEFILKAKAGVELSAEAASDPAVMIAQEARTAKELKDMKAGVGLDQEMLSGVTMELKARLRRNIIARGAKDPTMDFDLSLAEKERRNVALAKDPQISIEDLYSVVFEDSPEATDQIQRRTTDFLDEMTR